MISKDDTTAGRTTAGRRYFIGGSDARIVMGTDEAALMRLWRESGAKSTRKTCQVT